MQAPIPKATLAELLSWLSRRRRRLCVIGDSMLPTLQAGDVVLVDTRAYRSRLPAPGEIVVARHPTRPTMDIVKRVHFLDDDGRCYLLSDNAAEGTDSRSFGFVPVDAIQGRVTCRVS